jgi:hypothetical protein
LRSCRIALLRALAFCRGFGENLLALGEHNLVVEPLACAMNGLEVWASHDA